MNQLQTSTNLLPEISGAVQANQETFNRLFCRTHSDKTITYLIIDENIEQQKSRTCCESCEHKNKKYQLIGLVDAYKKYSHEYETINQQQINKMNEKIGIAQNFVSENLVNIQKAYQKLELGFSQILHKYKQEIKKFQAGRQFISVSELEAFAEYIGQNEYGKKQQVYENHLKSVYEEIQKKQKEEIKKLFVQTREINKLIYSLETNIESIYEDCKNEFENLKNQQNSVEPCHHVNQIQYLNMDININDDESRVQKLYYQLMVAQAFPLIIQEYFYSISYNLESFGKQFSVAAISFEIFFKKRIQNYEQLLNITDQQSVIKFAEEHLSVFYSQGNELDDYFNDLIFSKYNSEIEKYIPKMMTDIKKEFQDLESNFNEMSDLIRFRFSIQQMSKAIVKFKNCEAKVQFLQFNLEERQLNYIQDGKLIQFTSQRSKSDQQPQHLKNKYYQDFKISQDSSWFVAISIQENSHSIEFWSQKDQSYQIYYQTDIEIIMQLEVDSIHNVCFTFFEKKFMIWKYQTFQEKPQTIFIENFEKATFNHQYSLLLIQRHFPETLCLFKLDNNLSISPLIEVALLNVELNNQFDVEFMPQIDRSEFIMTFQKEKILIHKLDLKTNQFAFLMEENLQGQKIFFCQNENIFALIGHKSAINFYVVKQIQEGTDKFSISKFSVLYQFREQQLEIKFSQKGKYVCVFSENNQIFVYLVKRLPRISGVSDIPKIKIQY